MLLGLRFQFFDALLSLRLKLLETSFCRGLVSHVVLQDIAFGAVRQGHDVVVPFFAREGHFLTSLKNGQDLVLQAWSCTQHDFTIAAHVQRLAQHHRREETQRAE